jgi:hypothetical protein
MLVIRFTNIDAPGHFLTWVGTYHAAQGHEFTSIWALVPHVSDDGRVVVATIVKFVIAAWLYSVDGAGFSSWKKDDASDCDAIIRYWNSRLSRLR